ncbi:hypothetical protein B0T14DRAFT_508790 [Immersiella caudata]|uniref:Uncharacterized protein n=1 Tax=Immersiella caudata TaxID=314043 RepID=A0AA39X2T5_9PEZI|nr:hypothetical protein B0T14DRAFT_508790 [Immersiella caudata]
MRQRRITEFSPTVGAGVAPAAPSVSKFTKLPPNVRQTIYGHAGIQQDTTEAFIDLNHWSNQQPAIEHEDDYYYSARAESEDRARLHVNWKSRIPINLLLVCRAVHDDVEDALYRSHIWGVSASGPGGLDVLENLSPRAMKAMRCLLVSLTPCGCTGCFLTGACTHPISADDRLEHLGTYSCSGRFDWRESSWKSEVAHRCERPLDSRSSLDRRSAAQWDRICSKLARHAEPRLLSLYVYCAVKDVKTAEQLVVKPLRRLSLLKDFGISFGPRTTVPSSHGEQLFALAKATVQATTYQPSFPFLDLPAELQLRVLSFTHLVYDEFELVYTGGREWALSRQGSESSGGKVMELSQVDGRFTWLLDKAFCAKSSIAFRGRCYCCNRVPASYFLVNRRFHALASEVFYGCNHIVAAYNDIGWCTAAGARGWDAPPLTHVLQHIRRLTLIASIRCNVNATIGFAHLLDLLRAHARLPSLTLELHVRDAHDRDDVVAALRGVPGIPGKARRRGRHAEIYRVMVRHVRKKLASGGLKVFLFYLWWENFHPWLTGDDVDERRALEREKETEAMGQGYDSGKWGKEMQRKAFPRSRLWRR